MACGLICPPLRTTTILWSFATACTPTSQSRNSCSKITSTTPSSGIARAAWAKPLSIKSKSMPHWASYNARHTRHTSPIGMMARSKISRNATRANTIAQKISPSTFARNAATSRTCRSGSNAALIIRQYGGTLIRVAITPRSMGISSGTKRGQRKLPLTFSDEFFDHICTKVQKYLCMSIIFCNFAADFVCASHTYTGISAYDRDKPHRI